MARTEHARRSNAARRERLCEVTRQPCEWRSEEWYDDDGNMEAWDDFCIECGRWRDWSKDVAIMMKPAAPPRVPTADQQEFWTKPPPEPSARLGWWLDRIAAGWVGNKRVRIMGYDAAASYFGVYYWEYLNVLSPRLQQAQEAARSPSVSL